MGGPARSSGEAVNAATGGAEVFWETAVLWGATTAGEVGAPDRLQARISPTHTTQMETINRLGFILFSSLQSQFVCYRIHYYFIAILR
jgi:hypothetical protein